MFADPAGVGINGQQRDHGFRYRQRWASLRVSVFHGDGLGVPFPPEVSVEPWSVCVCLSDVLYHGDAPHTSSQAVTDQVPTPHRLTGQRWPVWFLLQYLFIDLITSL